tara:strand:- start:471 stop:1406 length:936 start_codon:yes stop_codon:yes gene_type:complete
MKSENTSTNFNGIVLAPCGRVGTNYIMQSIRSDTQYFNLGEFFHHHIQSLSIKLNIVNIMSDKKSDAIFAYKDFFNKLFIFFRKNNFKIMSNIPVSFEDLESFIDVVNEDLYFASTKFFNNEVDKNTITKMFMYNNDFIETKQKNNNIDLENILNYVDNLIIVYRKNLLLTYISETKALENHIWYIDNNVNMDKLQTSKDFKILWNKEDCMERCHCVKHWTCKMFEVYEKFNGRKCIIDYEILHSQENKIQYLQELYDKNKINITINPDKFIQTIKQSKDQKIEDNFTNPEEFLRDYDEVKEMLCYKMGTT